MIKVSVIIPVYNAERHIRQCLKSVLDQTLEDIEVICVDDGSSDSSPEIIEDIAARDKRVRLITQSNLYAGVARNNGMKNAEGEYLVFLDADDFFERDMLLEMYEKCVKDNAQICLCSGKIYNEQNDAFSDAPHYLNTKLLCEKTPFSAEDVSEWLFIITSPAPWTKMFKRDFIERKGIEFQSLKRANDLFFVYSALAAADAITYVNKPFVCYRTGNSESLQGAVSVLSLDFYTALFELKKELQKRGTFAVFEKSFVCRALSTCLYALDRTAAKEDFKTVADKLKKSYFYHLNILGHSRGYFYNKRDYNRLMHIMQTPSEQLWEEKNSPKTVKKKEKLNINEWHSPIDMERGGTKVSVIIPVYNTQEYLAECLDSVIGNTLEDIEIICVDDGSTDGSSEIIKKYAARDARIKALTKENGGLSSARNAGLAAASGEYVLFLDSDDYIEPRALEYLYAEAKSDNLDQLFFCAKPFYDGYGEDSAQTSDYYARKADYSGVMTGREIFIKMSENAEYRPSACLQLIRRGFLADNGISFINGIVYEDNPFTIQCLFAAERVRYADIDLYNRRLRRNSIMTSASGLKSSYNYFTVIKHIERIAAENKYSKCPEFYSALLVQLKRTCFLSSDFASQADEEEMNDFITGLDEQTGMDYYFFIKIAMEHRELIKTLQKTVRNLNEKILMDGFKRECFERECREKEQRERQKEMERLEKERKQAEYEKTARGKISRIIKKIKA